jgi:hypothetical protein
MKRWFMLFLSQKYLSGVLGETLKETINELEEMKAFD